MERKKTRQLQHKRMSHPLPADSELRSEQKETKQKGIRQQVIDACSHSWWWLTCFEPWIIKILNDLLLPLY